MNYKEKMNAFVSGEFPVCATYGSFDINNFVTLGFLLQKTLSGFSEMLKLICCLKIAVFNALSDNKMNNRTINGTVSFSHSALYSSL